MPRLEFVGFSQRDDDNPAAHTSRLINLFRQPIAPGGRGQHTLKSVLGTVQHTTLGSDYFVRDMREIAGKFYAMAGGTLYSVSGGEASALASTVSATGAMIFGADLGSVCTVSGGRYFVWDGEAMAEPEGGAFAEFGSGTFAGGYVILTEQDGRRFLWSDLADASTLPALNFATAESTDSNILRVIQMQGRVVLMKEDAIETWAATGLAGADAFTRVSGAVLEVGLKARDLVTRFAGGAFFIGSDGICYLMSGASLQPVSTPPVHTAIQQSTPTRCFVFEDEGHIFCVVRFSDRPAWCYDITTREWFERADGKDDPWGITTTAKIGGVWYGGDDFGRVYSFERTNSDAGAALIRTAVSNELYMRGARFRVPMVEFSGQMGQGETGDADPPQVAVRFSDDGGRTFGRERDRSLGAVGEYDKLVRIRGVGSQRRLCMEVTVSEPREISLDGSVNVRVA